MTSKPHHKSDRSGSSGSGLDRSSSTAFAWLSRRHSASLNLRRSVSSVSSRRHSSPIEVKAAAAASVATNSTGNSDNTAENSSSSPKSISKRWKKVVHKVLGNVEEEDLATTSPNNLKDGNSDIAV